MSGRSGLKITRLVKVLVMVVLLVLLARLVNLEALWHTVEDADPWLLLAAVIAALIDRVVMIGKWYPLLLAQLPAVPFWRASRAYLAANFASLVLPTSVGGDMLRAVALGRGRGAVMEVGASIVTERLLGIVASGVPSLIALLIAWQQAVALDVLLPWALASVGIAVVALVILSSARAVAVLERFLHLDRAGKWARLVSRFAVAYAAYSRHSATLIIVGVLSVFEQGFPVLIAWLVSLALGAPISLRVLLVAVPLVMFVARLPVSIAGIGVGEGAMVYILGLFGVPAVDALALALTARVPELAGMLPGALFWYDLAGVSGKATPVAAVAGNVPVTAAPAAPSGLASEHLTPPSTRSLD